MFKEFGIKSRMLALTLLPGCLLIIAPGYFAPELFTAASLHQRYLSLSLALLVLALGSLFAWRFGRSLEAQLVQLHQGIASLQNSQQNNPVITLHNHELNQLAERINHFGKALHSQRHELQQRLTQSLEDSRQHQQTTEIQRIELDMARKETRVTSRSKNGFLADMRHEIRTPLNGILGFSQLLHKTALNAQQRDHLQTIQQSAENLLGLLDQALDTCGAEAGNRHPDSQPFDLRELIHDCLSVMALSAHQKQLELVSMIYRDTPQRLLGDPPQLKQILINLLGNAVRFTAHGTIVLRAMLEADSNEFTTLRISVQSSGIGLGTTERQQVSNQPVSSAKPSRSGNRCELATARRLAECMGGEIGVESTPDGDTEWWLCISLAKTAAQDESAVSPLSGQRIAIFEAHELARQSLRHQLADYGLEVLSFEHIDELLDAVADQQHDAQPITLAALGVYDCEIACEQLQAPLRTLQQHHCKTLVLCPTLGQDRLFAAIAANAVQLQCKPAGGHKLTRALEELLDPPAVAPEQVQQQAWPDHVTAPRVLCVDDNQANLLLVESLLIDLGAQVTAVNSGYAALQATDAHSFDLILMDIRMPGMDGLQASLAIRQREQQQQCPAVPIVALTAHIQPDQKRSLRQAGINDLMRKPIDATQLAGLLQQWTGKHLPAATTPTIAPARETLAILDPHEALRLAGGKAELADDLLGMLLGSLDEEQQAIARARASNNADELTERVHRLLGATRYCGVPQLRTACQHCENLLNRGDARTGQALDQLDLAIRRLRQEANPFAAQHENLDR